MIAKILTLIIQYVQPITVGAFVVSSLCCFGLGAFKFGFTNAALAVANAFIFYGDKIFKR